MWSYRSSYLDNLLGLRYMYGGQQERPLRSGFSRPLRSPYTHKGTCTLQSKPDTTRANPFLSSCPARFQSCLVRKPDFRYICNWTAPRVRSVLLSFFTYTHGLLLPLTSIKISYSHCPSDSPLSSSTSPGFPKSKRIVHWISFDTYLQPHI